MPKAALLRNHKSYCMGLGYPYNLESMGASEKLDVYALNIASLETCRDTDVSAAIVRLRTSVANLAASACQFCLENITDGSAVFRITGGVRRKTQYVLHQTAERKFSLAEATWHVAERKRNPLSPLISGATITGVLDEK